MSEKHSPSSQDNKYDYEQYEELHNRGEKFFYTEYNCIYDMGLSVYALSLRGYLLSLTTKDKKVAWPSLKNISNHLKISRNTVKKAVEELIRAGLLKKELRISEKGDYANTIYTIIDPPLELIYKSYGSKMAHIIKAGGSPDDPPCNEMTGVGHQMTNGESPDNRRVGHEVITKNNHNKNNQSINIDLPSISSLRSDIEGHDVENPEHSNEPTSPDNESIALEDTDLLIESILSENFLDSLEGILVDSTSDTSNGITVEECHLPGPEKKPLPLNNKRQKKTKTGGTSAVIKTKTANSPEKPSKEDKTGRQNEAQLTNKDIIGSLGDAFLEISGMSERYPPGPQRKRIYALMGRLYNRLDCEPVYRAIDALRKKLTADKSDITDPLRYIAGVAEKCAQQIGREKTAGQNADDFYAAVKKIGEENAPTKEQRRLVREWYAAEEERAARYWKEREEEEERLRAVLETHYDDPLAEAIAEIQRDYAREKLYGTKDVGGAKHIGSCLDRLKTASN